MAKKSRQTFLRPPLFIAIAAFIILFVGFWGFYSKNYNSNTNQTVTVSDETADWKTYTSSFDSFTLKYPSFLSILEDKYNEKAFRVFIQNDEFQITIHPDGLSGESTLEAYRSNVETIGANQFTSYKISGEKALKYHLTAKGEDAIEIITIHNGKAYLITASPASSQHLSYLDQILSTFKFTD